MIAIKRVLCPVDFSDYSRRALDHAIAIAKWYGAAVTVAHVVAPVPAAAYAAGPVVFEPIVLTPVDRERLVADTKAFIEAGATPHDAVDVVVREGSVAAEIVDLANEIDADLLVLGTHGRSGFERLLLGSVAEKVLRKAACPVMTVPKRMPGAAAEEAVVYKRILCPIDFSESSLQALRYARALAQEADATLIVLHVVSHEFQNVADSGIDGETAMTASDFLERRNAALRQRLEAAAAAGDTEFCTVETRLMHGKPWMGIVRAAADQGSDLIVIGVQGRDAVDLMLFGSTTQHVVREAACPVLTLRHHGRRRQCRG